MNDVRNQYDLSPKSKISKKKSSKLTKKKTKAIVKKLEKELENMQSSIPKNQIVSQSTMMSFFGDGGWSCIRQQELQKSIIENDLASLNRLLRTDKLQSKFRDQITGKTLLHFAVENKNEYAVCYLLNLSPECLNYFLLTPDSKGLLPMDYLLLEENTNKQNDDQVKQSIITLLQHPETAIEKLLDSVEIG
jgi:hypothetical protein